MQIEKFEVDVSKLIPKIEPVDLNPEMILYSDVLFDILKKQIQEFEASLDVEHEVALKLTNFGQTITMRVTDIGYEESEVLIFKGYVGNTMSVLIQHMSQLNLLLTSVDKVSERPKKTIGFQYPSKG